MGGRAGSGARGNVRSSAPSTMDIIEAHSDAVKAYLWKEQYEKEYLSAKKTHKEMLTVDSRAKLASAKIRYEAESENFNALMSKSEKMNKAWQKANSIGGALPELPF